MYVCVCTYTVQHRHQISFTFTSSSVSLHFHCKLWSCLHPRGVKQVYSCCSLKSLMTSRWACVCLRARCFIEVALYCTYICISLRHKFKQKVKLVEEGVTALLASRCFVGGGGLKHERTTSFSRSTVFVRVHLCVVRDEWSAALSESKILPAATLSHLQSSIVCHSE